MNEPFQLKPNSGNLFRNDNKQTETQADYTGKLDVNGKLYFLSAWLNESKTGKKYLGLKISEVGTRIDQQPKQDKKVSEDIPF